MASKSSLRTTDSVTVTRGKKRSAAMTTNGAEDGESMDSRKTATIERVEELSSSIARLTATIEQHARILKRVLVSIESLTLRLDSRRRRQRHGMALAAAAAATNKRYRRRETTLAAATATLTPSSPEKIAARVISKSNTIASPSYTPSSLSFTLPAMPMVSNNAKPSSDESSHKKPIEPVHISSSTIMTVSATSSAEASQCGDELGGEENSSDTSNDEEDGEDDSDNESSKTEGSIKMNKQAKAAATKAILNKAKVDTQLITSLIGNKYPHDARYDPIEINKLRLLSHSYQNFAVKLLIRLFDEREIVGRNVYGRNYSGDKTVMKQPLDPERINFIKETVLRLTKTSNPELAWTSCVIAMNRKMVDINNKIKQKLSHS